VAATRVGYAPTFGWAARWGGVLWLEQCTPDLSCDGMRLYVASKLRSFAISPPKAGAHCGQHSFRKPAVCTAFGGQGTIPCSLARSAIEGSNSVAPAVDRSFFTSTTNGSDCPPVFRSRYM